MMLASLLILALPILLSAIPAAPVANDLNGKRLIKTSDTSPAQWMTDAQITSLAMRKIHFVDVTFIPERKPLPNESNTVAFPTTPTQQAVVNPIIALANTDLMKSALKTLTEFNNRYYRSPTGAQSSEWLFNKVKELVAASGTKLTVTVTQFKHTWVQSSIIARIEGKDDNKETVIAGAHQDSISGWGSMTARAPGADDDGSGTVTILEAFRMLLASGYAPRRPVEFQWYAGEEAGLLGSRAIADSYKKAGRVVASMMQMDMTMYPTKASPDIGIITDRVNTDLTNFVRKLVPEYTTIKSKDTTCGYGCSDHASWTEFGYPSSFPFESSNLDENGLIHTDKDTYDTVDFNHGLQFAKLAVGYIVEMST